MKKSQTKLFKSIANIIQFLILITLLLASCHKAPIGKYRVLAESSQIMLDSVVETYTRIEKLQRQFTVVTAEDGTITRDTFKPIIDGQNFDIVPELRFREAALEVLVKYFVVLQAFSEHDFVSEVDKASEELTGSLKQLAKTLPPSDSKTTRQASNILSKGINVIGREIVRRKRLSALKKVMDSTQSDIQTLTLMIVESNEKIKKFIDMMLDRIIVHANTNRPEYDNPIRFEFDKEIAYTITEVVAIKKTLDALSDTINKIPRVHADIRKILGEKPKELQSLQLLIEEVNRINKFYRGL